MQILVAPLSLWVIDSLQIVTQMLELCSYSHLSDGTLTILYKGADLFHVGSRKVID